jgi:uncharacterized membrane protein
MDFIKTIADISAGTLEIIGIGVIISYALYALLSSVISLFRRIHPHQQFKIFRHRMVRGILLGLEFMVAADIIYTVAIERTFESVGVLVLIVLVRTFLNFTLEVEMTGRWPWQNPFDEE